LDEVVWSRLEDFDIVEFIVEVCGEERYNISTHLKQFVETPTIVEKL
jgi:hypothetical protein